MSPTGIPADAAAAGPKDEICEFCGLPIESEYQRCPALADGRCLP